LFSDLHTFLKPGELLSGSIESEFYARMWRMARSDSFAPETGERVLVAKATGRRREESVPA
jgi:hypothetical protein